MSIVIFSLIVLLFSIVIHEVAHGTMAYQLGDSTAKDAGRLTLNPIKHLDPFGSVILPILLLIFTAGNGPIIGWAKPVPVNPYNLRDQKWGMLKVSLAGPSTNLLLAVIFALIIRIIPLPTMLLIPFSIIVIYNFAWGFFNLLPFYPLDGHHILTTLLPDRMHKVKEFLTRYGLFILIFFIFIGLHWLFALSFIVFRLISGNVPLLF